MEKSLDKAEKGAGRKWTMRSIPAATGGTSESAGLLPGQDVSDSDSDAAPPAAPAPRVKRAPAQVRTSAATQQYSQTPKMTQARPQSHCIAWIVLAVVLALLLIGGGAAYWWWDTHNDSFSSSASNSTTSPVALSTTPLGSDSASTTSSAAFESSTSSASGTNETSSGINGTSSGISNTTSSTSSGFGNATASVTLTGGAGSPSQSAKGNSSMNLGSWNSTSGSVNGFATVASATGSSAATASSTTQTGQVDAVATYFNIATGDESPCGTTPTDDDYVIHISPQVWGSVAKKSYLCGRWVSIWNGKWQVQATIQGLCATCVGNDIDLSRATFAGLGESLSIGTLNVTWNYLDSDQTKTLKDELSTAASAPLPTLASSSKATASAGGSQARRRIQGSGW